MMASGKVRQTQIDGSGSERRRFVGFGVGTHSHYNGLHEIFGAFVAVVGGGASTLVIRFPILVIC